MKFDISLEGNFVHDCIIEANSAEEAKEIAVNQFNKNIGLMPEDFVLDLITIKPSA